ncbi:MAG: hypothetical protein RLZZ337_629 [Bacteroidota bacterium]|jgi:hypothetical protein
MIYDVGLLEMTQDLLIQDLGLLYYMSLVNFPESNYQNYQSFDIEHLTLNIND